MPKALSSSQIQDFAREYVRSRGNGSRAAQAVGYAVSGASAAASKLLKRADVQAALQSETALFADELAPAMLGVLEGLARDGDIKPELRAKAASSVLDRGSLGRKSSVSVSVSHDVSDTLAALHQERKARLEKPDPRQVIDITPS